MGSDDHREGTARRTSVGGSLNPTRMAKPHPLSGTRGLLQQTHLSARTRARTVKLRLNSATTSAAHRPSHQLSCQPVNKMRSERIGVD